jgi:hypothetical protein
MGEMRILTAEGDETLEWDPDDKESVKKASDRFLRLRKEGYEFFTVEQTKGKPVKRFDKRLGRVIAAPGGKTQADRETGTRSRAMAGGPTARAE